MSDGYGMGYIADVHDPRDRPLYTSEHLDEAFHASRQRAADTKSVVTLPDLPPIYNQGYIGSCVANAVAAGLRYAFHKGGYAKYQDFDPSRLFLYFLARTRSVPAGDFEAGDDPKDKAEHDKGSEIRVAMSGYE